VVGLSGELHPVVLLRRGEGLFVAIATCANTVALIAQLEEVAAAAKGPTAIAVVRVVVEADGVGSTLEDLAARVEPEDIEGVEEPGRQSTVLTRVALFVEEGVTASSVEGVPTDCAQGKGSRGSEEA